MGLIGSLIIGAIAGIIAKAILGERYSFILTVIIGCIGGFLGGVLFGEKSGLIPQILVSVPDQYCVSYTNTGWIWF